MMVTVTVLVLRTLSILFSFLSAVHRRMSEDETSAYSESRSSEEDDSELDLGFNNGNGATFFTGEEVSPQSNDGNGDAHVEHGGQEVVQHTAMSLLSSDGEDGENEDVRTGQSSIIIVYSLQLQYI